ncbi:hypothetical protein CGRA01v4_11804 [Colletotrichum graminicola]|nr:hypothetical protein CGRA01v4_11804 [Colletotrichum graminicola]
MTFPEVVETAVMRSSDSSGEEEPHTVHHLPGIRSFPGTKTLVCVSGQQHNEQTSDKQIQQFSPPAQQVDQSMTQCEAPYIASTAKQPSPFRNPFAPPLEIDNNPVFRRSAAPMPAPESHADTFPAQIHRTSSVPRSTAPSLSNHSATMRSQSSDQQDSLMQPESAPRNLNLNDHEKSLAQFDYFHNTNSDDLEEKHLPSMRSPSWSPLTTPPESPLAPTTDIVDEYFGCCQTSSRRTSPVARQSRNQNLDSETAVRREGLNNRPPRTPSPSPQRPSKSKPLNPRDRVKGQNGRADANRGRRQAVPTRWSPVIPWSPNRKASFHYDLQQRLAAATRGAHIDNGLLKVSLENFDI